MALNVSYTITDIGIVTIENQVKYVLATKDWAPATAFSVGDKVTPKNDNVKTFYYEVTKAGTTADTEPAWPETEGAVLTDGTVEYVTKLRGLYSGTPSVPGQIISYYDLDDKGNPIGELKQEFIPINDAALFSDTLGVTDTSGTVKKNSNGNRVATDKVGDHQKNAHDWAKAKIKAARGI
jgi:hypothetical protein